MDGLGGTLPFGPAAQTATVPGFQITIVEGPNAGTTWVAPGDRCSIGSHPSNDLTVDEPTVSRFHCEVRVGESSVRVRDLGSRNGTILDGVQVIEGCPRAGSLLRLGRVTLRFELRGEATRLPLSTRTELHGMVGTSVAMRAVFALIERAGPSTAHVLIEGETGTGKTQAALALHKASARRDGPFVVVDCGAIPENLLESELFGHEKGAFTGAVARRIGAFEEADGGTLFLDEIGELAPALQPKLLRVLEAKEIRKVGGTGAQRVDVRVVAATNRDLRAEVNSGRFRSDLYFRLAVVKIALPPLREHPEDIPLLVEQLFRAAGVPRDGAKMLRTPQFLGMLMGAAWPGNVRELRNYLERCLVLEEVVPVDDAVAAANAAAPAATTGGAPEALPIDPTLPYAEARRRALDDFERRYASALLALHQGKVTAAAQAAGIDRVYLHRLLRRHGIR
jgi:transcriptional regulator with GAF, ATPase, and Fis domain